MKYLSVTSVILLFSLLFLILECSKEQNINKLQDNIEEVVKAAVKLIVNPY